MPDQQPNLNQTKVLKATWLQRLHGDTAGGFAAAILAFPTAISCGLLVFAPLGPDFIAVGVAAGLFTGVFTTLIASAFGGSPFQMTGPRSALAVVLAAFLSTLLDSPDLPVDPDERVAISITLMFLRVFMSGFFQIILGVLRLGNLIKYVPYPVIAGLLNGFAILIFINQFPVVLGLPIAANPLSLVSGQVSLDWLAIIVGTLTIVIMMISDRYIKFIPGSLVALVLGTLIYYLMLNMPSRPFGANTSLAVIGATPTHIPLPLQAVDFWNLPNMIDDFWSMMFKISGAALTLALLGSVVSLLSAVTADSISKTRHNSNQELIGQGLGNMVSASFGALAGGGAATRTALSFRSGATSRMASLVCGLFFLLSVMWFGPYIGKVPLVVVAGILIVFSVRMLDSETWRMLFKLIESKSAIVRRDLIGNVAVVFLVTAVTVVFDFVSATGVGLVIASLFFASRMGETIIRRQHRGNRYHSKTARPTHAMEILETHGDKIVIFEAQGPIFFGSADQLAKQIQGSLDDAEYIILDMRRVTEVDSTGLDILLQIDEAITSQDKKFYVSYLTEDRPLKRAILGLAKDWPAIEKKSFPDTDTALSFAEDDLLKREAGNFDTEPELKLHEIDVLKNLTDEEIQFLTAIFAKKKYPAGTTIFAQGEVSDAMYFLAAGTVSVRLNLPDQTHTVRLASFKPGVVFGEMGLMRAEERSANVIADDDVICYAMTDQAFNTLGEKHPKILSKMLLNMSRELSERLRITSDQVGELET